MKTLGKAVAVLTIGLAALSVNTVAQADKSDIPDSIRVYACKLTNDVQVGFELKTGEYSSKPSLIYHDAIGNKYSSTNVSIDYSTFMAVFRVDVGNSREAFIRLSKDRCEISEWGDWSVSPDISTGKLILVN